MLQKLTHFIKYHNALPIALSAILLSSGAVFAASPVAQQAVFSSEEKVQSIDNSFIVNTDLNTFSPYVQITNVIEDEVAYYITYKLNTINVVDAVWKETLSDKELTVHKDILGGEDLGLFVAEQLKEVVDKQLSYLKEAQAKEKTKGKTNKVVATTYSGLIGKFLDTKEEVIEGYTPVIQKPVQAVAQAESNSSNIATENTSTNETTDNTRQTASVSSAVSNANINNSSSPQITIIGNNPANIKVRSMYVDLGAMITNVEDQNFGIHYLLDGKEVKYINIDTSEDRTYTITYKATDQEGNVGIAERIVIVGTGIMKIEEVIEENISTSTPVTASSTPSSTPTSTTTE